MNSLIFYPGNRDQMAPAIVVKIGIMLFTIFAMFGCGRSELWTYVQTNDVAKMRAAITAGASVNIRGARGNSLLHAARTVEMVKCLVSAGADVNATNAVKNTPTHILAFLGDWRSVEYLAAHGANVDATNEWGLTPLHCAASSCLVYGDWENGLSETDKTDNPGKAKVIGILVAHGANVNAQELEFRRTPLFKAVLPGMDECVEYAEALLKNGANPNIVDAYGETPLDYVLFELRDQPADSTWPWQSLKVLLLKYGAVAKKGAAPPVPPSQPGIVP